MLGQVRAGLEMLVQVRTRYFRLGNVRSVVVR
jgi:hypothetical protein